VWGGRVVELGLELRREVCGVVGVRIGRVVCAEVAELGVNASRAESTQPKIRGVHCSWWGTQAAMNEPPTNISTGHRDALQPSSSPALQLSSSSEC